MSQLVGANWPAWRGPTGNGLADNEKFPSSFTNEKNIKWKVALPGSGSSTPAIWDDNIFITSPIIYDEATDKSTYMYPNEARLKNFTYKSCVYCNIGIKYIFHDEKSRFVVKNFEKQMIGCIPIMLHSKLCILNNLDPIKLTEFGECPYDQGGYFVIKGKEKVFLSQETKVNNILYINKINADNIILQGNIKTISNEGFQSSRTNNLVSSLILANTNFPSLVPKIRPFFRPSRVCVGIT